MFPTRPQRKNSKRHISAESEHHDVRLTHYHDMTKVQTYFHSQDWQDTVAYADLDTSGGRGHVFFC